MCGKNAECDCGRGAAATKGGRKRSAAGAASKKAPKAASKAPVWRAVKTSTGSSSVASVAISESILDDDATEKALTAAALPPEAEGLPDQWHAVLTVEGLRTTDHRAIARGALSWRQLPLPLFAQFGNAGHDEAPIVGQITAITRDEATGQVLGEGTFDLSLEDGRQAAAMCQNQLLRWGSIDLEILESRYVEVSTGGGDVLDLLFGDEEIGVVDWYDEVLMGRICGFTMVPIPAFPQAVIAPIDVELDIPEPMGAVPMVDSGLMAAAVVAPVDPPASWFLDPQLSEPTSIIVDGDGHVYGHLALWDSCHIGFEKACTAAPHSETDYAYFRTGRLVCDDGTQVRVGQLTLDTGHAGGTLGWQDTTAHYDNTGTAIADVNVGEDDFGIWFAGALRPGVDEQTVRVLRASQLSGDWRKIGGNLELVAALSVNVPGFMIAASAGMRRDEQVSLIAGGVRPREPWREIAREVAQLRRAVAPLLGQSMERLSQRVNGDRPARPVIDLRHLRERVNAA